MNSPILVTGTSKRVGLQLATTLAEAGNTVICVSRSLNPVTPHPNMLPFQANLELQSDREALIAYIKTNFDSLRAVIHNASLWLDDGLENLNSMFKLHVEAPYHLNLELGEHLLRLERSDIIHICDETSTRGSKSHIGYAATKSALQNMVLSFAEKYAPTIRVNAILPGLLILKENSTQEYSQRTLKKALLEFEPGAQPLIDAVMFLLNTNYSTGTSVVINGGRHIKKGIIND